MSVLPREQLSSAVNNDEFRNKTLLQIAVTEAIALLNGGKGQEAVSQNCAICGYRRSELCGLLCLWAHSFQCREAARCIVLVESCTCIATSLC
jgi:hypothetical protein